MRRSILASVGLTLLALAAACTRTLPDQDRRIVESAPSAKLSADILWKEFSTDHAGADRRYHGRALVVTGAISSVRTEADRPAVLFTQASGHGIEARLLDDQASAILKGASVGDRISLKCFCEGFDADVVLKSCVKP